MGAFDDFVKSTPGWGVLFGDKPKKVKPAAFDPKRPNWKGYNHFPTLRIVDRKTGAVAWIYEIRSAIQAYSSQEGARATIKPTAGGYHVDWPEGDASTTRVFTFTARTGEWPRGYANDMPDGMAEIAMMREAVDSYLRELDRAEYRMELFNPDEPVDEHGKGDALWEVVPQQFAPQRAAGVQDWRFTLRFEAVERLDMAKAGLKRAKIDDKKKKDSFWDKLRAAEQFLADNSFDAWFFKYQLLLGPLVRIKQAEGRLLSFVQGWMRGAHEFLGYPAALLSSMVDDFEALVAEFENGPGGIGSDGWDQWGAWRSDWRALTHRKREVKRLRNSGAVNASTSAQALGTTGDRQGGRIGSGEALPSAMQAANAAALADARRRGGTPGARRSAENGTIVVNVGPGMTLDSMTPAGFTRLDLLQLNPDLEWPYVDGSRMRPEDYAPAPGDPRVAYLGDAVRVPVPSRVGPAAVNAEALGVSRASEDERIFGRDLLVDEETRSLVLDPATNDLQTVVGVDNLIQRLRHRLVTPLGSLRSAPDVGSYLLAEDNAWATDTGTRLDAIAVRRTVQADPGIADVGRVDVVVENGARLVSFEADAVTSTPVGRVTFAV